MNRHTAEKRRTIEARMAGLDDIISNNAFLRGIANAMGMQREIEIPAELNENPRTARDDFEIGRAHV